MSEIKDRALKACEDIFNECPEYIWARESNAIKRAWRIGEQSCLLGSAPSASCPICGAHIIGDGYTTVRHCENADVPADIEPDADTLFCNN